MSFFKEFNRVRKANTDKPISVSTLFFGIFSGAAGIIIAEKFLMCFFGLSYGFDSALLYMIFAIFCAYKMKKEFIQGVRD